VNAADNRWRDLREECSKARMHTPTKAGISGGREGAYSIVMSGGYTDDIDKGDFMCVSDLCFRVCFVSPVHRLYTGTGGYGEENRYGGGSSWGSRVQSEDQTFDHKDNKALFVRSRSLAEGADSPDRRIDILRTGYTRPGHPRVRLGFEIRTPRRVCGQVLRRQRIIRTHTS